METGPLFNTVDIVVLISIALGTLNGLRRGFSGEIAATISAVFALLFGLVAYGPLGGYVAEYTRLVPRSAHAFTFVLTILVAFIVMLFIRWLIKNGITVVINNKKVDRFGGIVAGLAKSSALSAIVLIGVNMWPHPYLNRVFGEESFLGRNLTRLTPEIREQAQKVREKIAGEIEDRD